VGVPAVTENFGLFINYSTYEFVFKTTDSTDVQSLTGFENLGSTVGVTLLLNENSAGTTVANNVRFFIRSATSGNSVTVSFANSTVCNGSYHHLVCTYANGTATCYLDGAAQTLTTAHAGTQPPSPFAALAVPIVLGAVTAHGTATNSFANVTLDEVAFYTNALTSAQVLANYYALTGNVTNDAWTAAVSTNWDTTTANWTNTPNANLFANGDLVTFGDAATNFNVNLAANVTPLIMTFTNSLNNYTFGSTGNFGIGGVATLNLLGTGSVTLDTTNTFVGPMTISSGQFVIGGAGQLGAGNYGGTINNNGVFLDASTSKQTLGGIIAGNGTLAVNAAGAALTLTNINAFTGPTILDAGTLFLTGSGSLSGSSSITVSNGAVFDVTGASTAVTLGANQNLLGGGTINGSLTTAGTSKVFPGMDGTIGTLTFNNNLTLTSGSTVSFDVGTTYNGANDNIVVSGALHLNNNTFHLKAPSTSASLDTAADYVLITATGGITGSFFGTPTFDVAPVNAGNYTIVTDTTDSPNVVKLHYRAFSAPTAAGTATPSTGVLRNQTVAISVTVTPGSSPTINSVTLNLSPLGGSATAPLALSATPNVWTNSIIIPPGTTPGVVNLTATATDANSLSGFAPISLTVVASTENWSGLGVNQSWDTNANWQSGSAPGYAGDSLVFAGTTGLTPVLDQDYTVSALTFDVSAGSFTLTNAPGDYLTLASNIGVTNAAAGVEIVALPVELAGAVTLVSTSVSGPLVFTQPVGELVAGNGSIINAAGTNILSGLNTYSGNTVVNAGALTIGPGGDLGNGSYAGAIINNGVFSDAGGMAQTFNGFLSGAGLFNFSGGGSAGPIITLNAQSTFTGNLTVSNSYVSDIQGDNATSPTSSGVGNPVPGGRTFTINNNGVFSFDVAYPMGSGNSNPQMNWIINSGGVLQNTVSPLPSIGLITLDGGTLIPNGGMGLNSTVTVGGSSPSLITNSTAATLTLGVGASGSIGGQTTFNVAATGASGPDLTVAVPLSSAAGLIKAGTGTMALTANNTFTGNIAINAGTLTLANSGQLDGGTYAGHLTNNSVFVSSTTSAQTLSGIVSGSGILEVSGPGAVLSLTAANTYSGGTVVSNGATLNVLNTSGSATGTNTVTVTTNATLAGTGSIAGNVIWQAGALAAFTAGPSPTPLSVGVITLNSNTVTVNVPGTALTAGTYTLMTYNATGSTGAFNPTPNFSGAGLSSGLLANITTSGGVVTLTVSVPVPVGDVWIAGNGNWSAGANWSSNPTVPGYPGDAALLGVGSVVRTVTLNTNESLGYLTFTNVNGFVVVNPANTLTLDNNGNGAYISVSGGSNVIQTAVSLNDSLNIAVSSGDVLTISGVVSNSLNGARSLTVGGTGKVILANTNAYGPSAGTTGTTLTGGTLQAGSSTALGLGDVNVTGASTLQAGTAVLNLTNNLSLNSGVTLTFNDNGDAVQLAGNISGSGALLKIGSGTNTLTAGNSFGGGVTITNGTLVLAASSSGGNGSITNAATLQLANDNAFNGALVLNSGSTLQLRSDANDTFQPNSVTLQNAADILNFDVNNLTSGHAGYTLSLADNLAFTLSQANQVINVTGGNGYTLGLGSLSAISATSHTPYQMVDLNVIPGLGVSIGGFTSGNWGDFLDFTGGGSAIVTGGIGNTSNGSVILCVNSGTTVTLQGQTTKSAGGDAYRYLVQNGVLVADNSSALINDTTGANNNMSLFTLGPVTNIVYTGATSLPTGYQTVNTNNNVNCAFYLGDTNNTGGNLTLSANVTNNISDGDAGFTNNGVMTLGGQNTSGVNTFANNIILGWTANRGKSVTLVAAPGGEVDFTGNLLANGTDKTAGITVGNPNFTGLVKLTGTNTYGGPTLINAGTLALANNGVNDAYIGNSTSIVISPGATLDVTSQSSENQIFALGSNTVSQVLSGAGTLNGSLGVGSLGTVAPGSATTTGMLTVNDNVSLGGAVVLKLNNIGTPTNDELVVNGTLTGGGVLTVTNLGPALVSGSTFHLFNSAVTGFSTVTLPVADNNHSYTWNNQLAANGTIVLTSTTVLVNTNAATAHFKAVATGSSLQFNWAPDHQGWQLYTNSVSLTVTNAWHPVTGSASTTNETLTINPTQPQVFFQLRYP
jgi:autotransporter-associated beta strand protein